MKLFKKIQQEFKERSILSLKNANERLAYEQQRLVDVIEEREEFESWIEKIKKEWEDDIKEAEKKLEDVKERLRNAEK